MSDAYATVDIPKSLPIHGMALTSTGRKIEHNKVVAGSLGEVILEIFLAHQQCERGGTARCVGGVHMFLNGSNHPYGCIQQCQSEGHWNNTPQTPNLTSYLARNIRMGTRFSDSDLSHPYKTLKCFIQVQFVIGNVLSALSSPQ